MGPPSFRLAAHCQRDHISEHRAAPSTPCPRAVLPTSQRDPRLEGQFHLDGERSRGAVRPLGPCTTLGRREGRSRGPLDEDTEDRSGRRAPTGREAVADNSAQTPTPGFGDRSLCPGPAAWLNTAATVKWLSSSRARKRGPQALGRPFSTPAPPDAEEPALAGAGEALSLVRVSAGTDASRHCHREVVPGHEGHRLVSQSLFSSFCSGKKVTRPL